MKPETAPDSTIATLLQKIGRSSAPSNLAQPSNEETNQSGEATWRMSQVVGMLRRKAVIIGICSLAMAGLTGVRTAKNIPEFEGSFRLLVEPVTRKAQVADQLTDTKTAPTSDKGLDYSTQIEVLYSPKLLNPILKEVNKQYPGSTIESISPKLAIIRLGETKIIEISYRDTNSDKVLLILESLARGYLEYSQEEQQAQLKQGIKFVAQELPKIQNRVNLLQKQLEQLRQQYNFVDPESASQDLAKQLGTLSQQRQALQTEMVAMQTQRAILNQQLGRAIALQQSATYQATLQKFQVLEQQIAIESARFGPNAPNIQFLKRQQENLVPILLKQAAQSVGDQLAKVENDLQISLARYRALSVAYNQLNQQFRQMPSVSRQYSELQRELGIATESLTRFLQAQDDLQIQAAKDDIPWQLLSEPKQPKLKPGSDPIKSMISGAITGIMLGIALSFLLEKLQNTYFTVDELKHKVKLRILGTIPLHPGFKDGVAGLHIVDLRSVSGMTNYSHQSISAGSADLKHRIKDLLNQPQPNLKNVEVTQTIASTQTTAESLSLNLDGLKVHGQTTVQLATSPEQNYWLREYDAYGFMEAFRTLYTNIQYLGMESHVSLVVSTSLPSEGGTTVAIHLAQAAAAMGKRVLLVDAHLRRGSVLVHSLLGLSDAVGLSEYLSGKASLSEAVQRLSWESNLFVMGAGDLPPDPTRLLASEKMQQLKAHLQQTFDLVLYVVPPLMGLADVKLIAAQTDGILLVSRLGKWGSAKALSSTLELLNLAHLPCVGIVANGQKNYTVDLYA